MTGLIGTVFDALAANRVALRRARNLRAARAPRSAVRKPEAAVASRPAPAATDAPRPRGPAAVRWIGAASILLALGGALAIASHARMLAATAGSPADGGVRQVDLFQPALPGAAFQIPAKAGVAIESLGGGALLVAAGMRAEAPLRIDLCSQMLETSRPRLLPLRIGHQFSDVARWVARNDATAGAVLLRNVVLAAPGAPMPRIEIGGMAVPGFADPRSAPLRLRWSGADAAVRWVGDGGAVVQGASGQGALRLEGWLVWSADAALRFGRRASAACPQAGELVLQLFRTGGPVRGKALAVAFAGAGAPLSAWLAPGDYRVPTAPPPGLEDQALFEQLCEHGLVRLGASGLIELAPPDLPAWQAAPEAARAGVLASWNGARLDDTGRKLLARLYHRADGEYVREQVRVFNSERRLLAWRVRAPARNAGWQASVGGAPAATTGAMPGAAARLFAQLPQGWAPWMRIASWPDAGAAAGPRLALALPNAAAGGETLQVLLAGRVGAITGARLRSQQDACTGRACPAAGAVQLIELELEPGARTVTLAATPLDIGGLAAPGDAQYRHLRVAGGRLEWQRMAGAAGTARAPAADDVTLADRSGAPLWRNGAPTATAGDAGLAPLLGLNAAHANSIAGMLARLPSAGSQHQARLTLDLALQASARAALDCIGMRRGQWDGSICSGGAAAPEGRQAGIVLLDTETGDVLAAAGAGTASVNAGNWKEVRDFDRADPARSPLRLPAFQHDGGAHRSPGSTFKIVSALGLELAARGDPQLDAMLGGLPLAAIDRVARERGFAFRTDAAVYPAGTRLAHISNFRDQRLDKRAQDGRLGLVQTLTYSQNTWFAWASELSDRSLFGRPQGGAPGLQALEPGALDAVRPIADMAHRLGFERALRLDGGLLPEDFAWSTWDALQASPAHVDPIHSRHELRQMAIGLRMQATPLQMALVAGAVGQGRIVNPRLLLALDGRQSQATPGPAIGVRLDRIRAGMKGVVDAGTAAGTFRGPQFEALRRGLYGKTGTAPTGTRDAAGRELATVWFTGWLEPGTLPGQARRLAFAAFVSASEATGGEHAAPIVAAVLRTMAIPKGEQKGK